MRLRPVEVKRQFTNTDGTVSGTCADRKHSSSSTIRTRNFVAYDKLGQRTRLFANFGHNPSQGDGHSRNRPSGREIAIKPKTRSRPLHKITARDRRHHLYRPTVGRRASIIRCELDIGAGMVAADMEMPRQRAFCHAWRDWVRREKT